LMSQRRLFLSLSVRSGSMAKPLTMTKGLYYVMS
jgi:hypothetical protein